MSVKTTGLAIIGAVIFVLLGAGLVFLNIRAATSNTNTNSSVSTARLGADRGAPTEGMQNLGFNGDPSIWLYIEGDDAVTAVLRHELLALLEGKLRFARVTLLQTPPTDANHPAMVAAISEQEVTWTPVYARARLRARFAFASDKGNISWRDEEAFVLYEPAVRLRGDLTVADETRGLISRPAYTAHLGRAVAEQIIDQLQRALEGR
ncbi:MAG: hypothetical protein HYY30_14040 [Chloroflexi bacterium]|nr:hypothetical protein [Chloroflexota bacterium]